MSQRKNLLYMLNAVMDIAASLDQREWVISFSVSSSGLSVGIWNRNNPSDERKYFENVVIQDVTRERMQHINQRMEAFADTIRDTGIRKPAETNNQ